MVHTWRGRLAIFAIGVVLERVLVHASNPVARTAASDPEVTRHITAEAMQLAVESAHILCSE